MTSRFFLPFCPLLLLMATLPLVGQDAAKEKPDAKPTDRPAVASVSSEQQKTLKAYEKALSESMQAARKFPAPDGLAEEYAHAFRVKSAFSTIKMEGLPADLVTSLQKVLDLAKEVVVDLQKSPMPVKFLSKRTGMRSWIMTEVLKGIDLSDDDAVVKKGTELTKSIPGWIKKVDEESSELVMRLLGLEGAHNRLNVKVDLRVRTKEDRGLDALTAGEKEALKVYQASADELAKVKKEEIDTPLSGMAVQMSKMESILRRANTKSLPQDLAKAVVNYAAELKAATGAIAKPPLPKELLDDGAKLHAWMNEPTGTKVKKGMAWCLNAIAKLEAMGGAANELEDLHKKYGIALEKK